jgi:hypothetical protein
MAATNNRIYLEFEEDNLEFRFNTFLIDVVLGMYVIGLVVVMSMSAF